MYSATSHPLSATAHPLSATSHPHSATSHPHSTTSHPHSATSHPHSATSHPHSATSRSILTASTRTIRDCHCCVLFRVLFSSAEWFGTEFREFSSILGPRNGIPSFFLFRLRVRKGIPRICFYFSSMEWNSELFSPPLKGSEGNCESLLLFLVHGTEFRVVFSSAEGFGTEFR